MGIEPEVLISLNYCAYTSTNPIIFGEIGKTYDLEIITEGETYTSSTQIPLPVELDSTWFRLQNNDSLGYVWAQLTDPIGLGNAYRWSTQRINEYTFGEDEGEQKDQSFIPAWTSVFDDQFFDGLSFDFWYDRGKINSSNKLDDNNEESGFWKLGDTIVVEFSSIDRTFLNFIGC